jgi:hypothetical protein
VASGTSSTGNPVMAAVVATAALIPGATATAAKTAVTTAATVATKPVTLATGPTTPTRTPAAGHSETSVRRCRATHSPGRPQRSTRPFRSSRSCSHSCS